MEIKVHMRKTVIEWMLDVCLDQVIKFLDCTIIPFLIHIFFFRDVILMFSCFQQISWTDSYKPFNSRKISFNCVELVPYFWPQN